MKRIIGFVAAFMIAASLLAGCGSQGNQPAGREEKLQIVTTIFPEYDWVMNILGDDPAGAEVTMLMGSGVDLHSFQPTAADIMKISTCDIFIYVGGESDRWVEGALKEAVNDQMVVVSLMDVLGDCAKEEESVEGMQDSGGAGDETEYDEHVWLSLKNASLFVDSLSGVLAQADPENAGLYEANAAAYIEKLEALDRQYEAAISEAGFRTLLFGDRFPFRYLTDDYGLDYYAAFSGCSAETEASFETLTFLSKKLDELGLPAVIIIDGSDSRLAETIVQNTGSKDQQILRLDSMQATTSGDVANGATYIAIMATNLEVLEEALNR